MTFAAPLTGHFIWHDLLTSNVAEALDYYSGLFPQWSVQTFHLDGHQSGHVISVDGREHATIIELPADTRVCSYWTGHIAVDDARRTAEQARQAGGRLVVPVVTIPNVGHIAVIEDIHGAAFQIIQPLRDRSIPPAVSIGAFCRNELLTTDIGDARSFYQTVFGWSVVERSISGTGSYTLFRIGADDVATGMSLPVGSNSPPAWLAYVAVSDVEAQSARSVELGGRVWLPPQTVTGIGRLAVHIDPTGATFGMLQA